MNKTYLQGRLLFRHADYLMPAIVLLTMSLFQACTEDDREPQPSPESEHLFEFEVNEPVPAYFYQFEDTVWISAGIKSKHPLHDYYIEINDMTAMKRVFLGHGHVHTEGMLHVDTFWVNRVTQPSEMEMVISASDHEGGYHRDTTRFHCKH